MKMGDSVPEFLEKTLISIQNLGIEPNLILVDREFFSVDCIRAIGKRGVVYLMLCRNSPNVIIALLEFALNVRPDTTPVAMEDQSGSAEYWMKIEKRKSYKDPTKLEQKYMDLLQTILRIDLKRYKNRWMIEAEYREIEAMKTRTRTNCMSARMMCFYYSILMCNECMICKVLFSFYSESIMLTLIMFKFQIKQVSIREPKPTP